MNLQQFIEKAATQYSFQQRCVAAKTTLLREGEISKYIYFVKRGALRMWFNKEGKDITFQFFFEQSAVASIDSFFLQMPGAFQIEAIEESEILMIDKSQFDTMLHDHPEFKDEFIAFLVERFRNYRELFLSRIKDTPEERYRELLRTHPEVIRRVPQHYIASYLGITSVSLSRIRNRK